MLAPSLTASLDFDQSDVAARHRHRLEPHGSVLAAALFRTDRPGGA